MSSTLARIDKDLYIQLQKFAHKKHKSFRCAKTEIDEAVKQYLANQQDPEKEN